MSNILVSQEREVRIKLNEALTKYGIKQVDVARETGIHHSTLSLWLQGKLKGNNSKIEEQIDTWLHNLYSNKPKLFGAVSTRFELLKGKKDTSDFPTNIDDNNGFGNLIPINIIIELEGKKFKEIFFWDLDEPYLSVEHFAKILVEDNQLPQSFDNEIMK